MDKLNVEQLIILRQLSDGKEHSQWGKSWSVAPVSRVCDMEVGWQRKWLKI